MKLAAVALGMAMMWSSVGGRVIGPERSGFCSYIATRWADTEADDAVLVVATNDFQQAYHIDLPFYEPPGPIPEGQIRIQPVPDSARYILQRFVVVESAGGNNVTAGGSLWVTPVQGCAPSSPKRGQDWVPDGDTVTFLFDPKSSWPGPEGAPLFLQHTQLGPHPGSGEARRRPELSGAEYFAFVEALPSSEGLTSDPRAAVEAFESWVRSNVDSTAYPVASTLTDLRGERQRRPIFWDGYPYLIGCYEMAYSSSPPGHPLMDDVERRVYLSELPVRSGVSGGMDYYVVRTAPGEVVSDFKSVIWGASSEQLWLVWRRDREVVHASFGVDHAAQASAFVGTVTVFTPDRRLSHSRTPATLARVSCQP